MKTYISPPDLCQEKLLQLEDIKNQKEKEEEQESVTLELSPRVMKQFYTLSTMKKASCIMHHVPWIKYCS